MRAEDLDRCFTEASIGSLKLRNRLIKAATSTGLTPGGAVTPELIRFHERMGRGGVGMTTVAYCAAEADGRLHEDMVHMHEGLRHGLRELIERVHAAGAGVSGQLGHAGGFTKLRSLSTKRALGPSRGINRLGASAGRFFVDSMSQAQLAARVAAFGRAAAFMQDVGFDAIELHFGHGYGLSQFISPKTNRRSDRYGGSLENRMRHPLEVLAAVREAVGEGYPLLGKISMSDGVKGGVDWRDAPKIARLLDRGGIDVVVCSAGTSSMNPNLLFRGGDLRQALLKHADGLGMRLALRAAAGLFREYAYEELYNLEPALRVRDAVECGVCYVGGVSCGESIARLMAEGFDFVELGRALIFDPEFPRRVEEDAGHVSGCTHCNECAALIEAPGGIRCVLREKEV